ncbi:hypothetical protein LVJ94_19980 [Pendulispora rubella]|uniref:Uncharacterized protein n=1 Tax=Pendulispora rubella TaxID=2741070 RepID=A0ABZ2LFF2_9BACT
MLLGAAVSSFALSTLSACSSNDDSNPPPDAGNGSTTFPRTVPISLEKQLDPQKKYRLGVIWAQLDDDGPDPLPEVAIDVSFDPAATNVTFDAPPVPSEANFFCERSCDDEAKCPCLSTSKYRIAYGAIVLVLDADQNGKIELDFTGTGASKDRIELFGYGAFVHSPNGNDALPQVKDGVPLVDGAVQQGTALYRAIKKTDEFDRLTRFINGDTLEFRTKAPSVT